MLVVEEDFVQSIATENIQSKCKDKVIGIMAGKGLKATQCIQWDSYRNNREAVCSEE